MEQVISSKSQSYFPDFKKIWRRRELLYFLMMRDISVRYKQTLAGFFWLLLQPLLTVFIFTFVFGQITKISVFDVPYPVFVFAGLIFWNLFSRSIITSSESIIANQNLVKKIAFPRIILPLSSIGVHLVDFVFSFLILLLMMLIFNYRPNLIGFLMLPLVLFLTLISSFGIGCFFAAVNVKYRDIRLLLPFLVQLLFFLTPIIYPLSSINQKYQFLLLINPVAGGVETFKGVLFGNNNFNYQVLLFSIIISLTILIIGVIKFTKDERFFTDIV